MIYITGDIHGRVDISKLNSKNFKEGKTLTKDDYVIICGDFGLVWGLGFEKEDHYFQKWLNEKPWTTLFIDGNHENFDLLNSYKKEQWHGGYVHKISDSIIHLMRGEIYNIDNLRVFTFGGGASHDIKYREEGKTWWKEELPTLKEIDDALEHLTQYNHQIDIIITHDGPTTIINKLGYKDSIDMNLYNKNQRNIHDFFDLLYKSVSYRKWYMGHYHIDKDIDNICILFDEIKRIY